MLPLFAITVAALFFILLRMGILDELPRIVGQRRTPPRRKVRRMLENPPDVEEAKRLEIFKDFLEGDSESEE